MDPETASATDKTARGIVAGTWMGAGIVMATNAAHAVAIFGALGGNRLVGLGVGVAVDVALCVGLIGDRRLAQYSLVSQWGRSLRVVSGVVSMVIAVGGALITSHPFLAVLLGSLPIVLCLLTEYGQDVLLKFAALRPAPTPVPEPATAPTPVVDAPPVQAPVLAPIPPKAPARPVLVKATQPKAPSGRRREVTPQLLHQVREWQRDRANRNLPISRRAMLADPGLDLSDGMARKVMAALAEETHTHPLSAVRT